MVNVSLNGSWERTVEINYIVYKFDFHFPFKMAYISANQSIRIYIDPQNLEKWHSTLRNFNFILGLSKQG